ncbi:MT-A70 family methyltransferase [Cereibacter johrii]|uniref:MT-A70 protein n=1 Tax=Cereibacter johrii TaxID=445629 RepID=A0ABX5J650_9RHOB|nr:MT-A70 family methyltransferase [Cereibacter johrii]PTM78380.1 MT-A70 protein [Cereibacter johrii]
MTRRWWHCSYPQFLDTLRFQLTTRAESERLTATDPDTLTDLERAARFLYLQRTAFGGKVRGQNFGVSMHRPGRFNLTTLEPMLEDLHSRLRYVTGGSWNKRTSGGKTAFGTGYILRSASEPFLVGKIGSPQIASRSCRNLIDADEILDDEIPDTIEAIRREHSRKPLEMREMVEALLPRAFACELFAREPWAGHDVWDNETDRFAEREVSAA